MIRELHLSNFKKHTDSSFTFTEGLNGVFGPNYAGKTTILYGILYALGGASQVPGSNLQTVGTNSGMCVTMLFDVGGRVYRVERKKNGAYLYEGSFVAGGLEVDNGEQLIASGTSNVNEKVAELLGMPMKRFRQLKYAEQKKAHALLTLGATELHKIIEELTGIDEINLALSKLKDIITETKGALEVLEYEDPEPLHSDEEELAITLTDLNLDVEGAENRLEDCKKVEAKAKEVWHDAVTTRDAMLKEKEAVGMLESTLEIRLGDLKDCKQELMEREEFSNLEEKLAEVEENSVDLKFEVQRLEGFEAERVKLVSDIEAADRFISRTAKVIKGDSETCDSISATIENEVHTLEEIHKEISDDLNKAQYDFSNKKDMLKNSFCPTCKRKYDSDVLITEDDVDAAENLVDELAGKERAAKEDLKSSKTNLSIRERCIIDIQRNTEELEKSQTERKELSARVAEIDADEDFKNLSYYRSILKDFDADKVLYERLIEERGTLYDKSVALHREVTETEEALKNRPAILSITDEEYQAAKEKAEKSAEATADAKDKLSSLKEDRAGADAQLKSVRKHIEIVEDRNKLYDASKKKNGTATALKKFLTDNRDRYTSQVWQVFMASASNFVSDCTSGAITEIERTSGGKFQFIENEQQMDIKDASGAQESIMGLAVQLALAEAAQCPLDILLVDEPTADMDADHSMAVAGILSTKGSQIIAISHREMDASLCQNVITLGV